MLRHILRINHWLLDLCRDSLLDAIVFLVALVSMSWLLFEALFPAL